MKLLASVLTVAAADYACCPYDDFGIPESTCLSVLNEKSPFSPTPNNALVPVESYACKAWEANAGAMSESHKGTTTTANDWGSCGFQRHFPWYHTKNNNANDNAAKLGLWTAGGVANYQILATGGTFGSSGNGNFNMLSLARGSFSGATEGSKPVVGDVHLGAVCKLFVPVQKSSIRQVSVAGVHINNARVAAGATQAFSSAFNAAVIGNIDGTAGGSHSANYHAGTAYCFSVVNIGEFMTNRANNIANANVAGEDITARGTDKEWFADDVGFKYDASGVQSAAQFGSVWPGFDQATGFGGHAGTAGQKESGQHKVNMGSNFDVVVHFESSWCASHWNIVDMQKVNDHGNQYSGTGNLAAFDSSTNEALMDAWDKRLPVSTGSCGLCYDKTDTTRNPNNGGVSACNENAVAGFAATGAGADEAMGVNIRMDYNSAQVGSPTCTNLNGYSSSSTNRWPNAGAWAAFYSFVTCARSDYMIYGPATRHYRKVTVNIAGGTAGANHLAEDKSAEGPEAYQDGTFDNPNDGSALTLGNNDNRMVIVGGWHQDYRHGAGACVRFNLRQVGNNIEYCADGDEERFNKNPSTDNKNPTGDTSAWSQNGPKRCTWNWNYNILKNGSGKEFDAEAWFDSVDPLHQQVWAVASVIDEPAPGTVSSQAQGYAAAMNTLTSPLRIMLLIQDTRPPTASPAYVPPTGLEFDATSYMTAGSLTSFVANPSAAVQTTTNAAVKVFDFTTAGTYAQLTVACTDTTTSTVNRNIFPDCFFGDEIHGQWVWSTGLGDLDAASYTSPWKFWAMIKNHKA